MAFCILKSLHEGEGSREVAEGTAEVLLCPVPFNAGTKRGMFEPTTVVLVVGHYLILGLVTPHNANPSCKNSSACSEQDSLVGGMC